MTTTPRDPLGLADRRTLFYPGCGFDWNPLRRLTHLADTFVYCDWATRAADFLANLPDFGEDLTVEDTRPLNPALRQLMPQAGPFTPTAEEAARYENAVRDLRIDTRGWGYDVRLRRRFGTVERRIRLLYFGAEGVATYHSLFCGAKISPAILVLYRSEHDASRNWTDFYDWDAPLARVVRSNPAGRPKLLLVAKDAREQLGWPYGDTWQVLWPWGPSGAAIALAETAETPSPPPAPPAAARRVGLVRGGFSKDNWRGADAILVPARVYGQNRWLDECPNLTVIVDTQHEQPPEDANVVRVHGIFTSAASAAWQQIADLCATRGIDHLATIPVGYEDEGELLLGWRQANAKPSRLTLYTIYPGDAAAFLPYVDAAR